MKNLRRVIREMVISEVYEHTDDEIVTFQNIDLQHEYDKLNDLLFNGELPRVDLFWNSAKGAHGMVKSRWKSTGFRGEKKVSRILGLYLSKFFKIPYKMFKDTLAHEMIHVKNLKDMMDSDVTYTRRDAHGYDFIREMNRINSMGLGFNVTVRAQETFDVSDHIKGRQLYLGILKINGAKNGVFIIAMTPSAFQQKEVMENIFRYSIDKGKYIGVEIDYYKSDDPYFLKFKIQRNFNSNVSYKVANDADLQRIKEKSEFINSFSLGKQISQSKEIEPTFIKPEPKLAQTEPPRRMPEPEIKKPEVSDEMKEINRKVMAIFKSTADKIAQEKLFDILKTSDPIKKQIKIDNFNQSLGPRFGFIE